MPVLYLYYMIFSTTRKHFLRTYALWFQFAGRLDATYALNFVFNQTAPSQPQLASAGLIVMALAFLSPLHHFQRVLRSVRSSLNGAYEMLFSFCNRL